MTDYKQLCAELLSTLENDAYAHWIDNPDEDELIIRARTALTPTKGTGMPGAA